MAEETKARDDKFAALDELGKVQFLMEEEQKKTIEEMKTKGDLKRLTKDQKDALFKAIRYGYLYHEELVDLSVNPDFLPAKDYIFEGLSYRLNPFEHANRPKEKCKINLARRKNYDMDLENKIQNNFA